MRKFVRVYEEFNDNSAYEHVNPNIVKRIHISTIENDIVYVDVHYHLEEDVETFPFTNIKEAQRFINRISNGD